MSSSSVTVFRVHGENLGTGACAAFGDGMTGKENPEPASEADSPSSCCRTRPGIRRMAQHSGPRRSDGASGTRPRATNLMTMGDGLNQRRADRHDASTQTPSMIKSKAERTFRTGLCMPVLTSRDKTTREKRVPEGHTAVLLQIPIPDDQPAHGRL